MNSTQKTSKKYFQYHSKPPLWYFRYSMKNLFHLNHNFIYINNISKVQLCAISLSWNILVGAKSFLHLCKVFAGCHGSRESLYFFFIFSKPVTYHKTATGYILILQNSRENICTRISSFINLQAEACNFIKKETLALVFHCEFCKISKSTIPSKYTFYLGTVPWIDSLLKISRTCPFCLTL